MDHSDVDYRNIPLRSVNGFTRFADAGGHTKDRQAGTTIAILECGHRLALEPGARKRAKERCILCYEALAGRGEAPNYRNKGKTQKQKERNWT